MAHPRNGSRRRLVAAFSAVSFRYSFKPAGSIVYSLISNNAGWAAAGATKPRVPATTACFPAAAAAMGIRDPSCFPAYFNAAGSRRQ